MEDSGVDTGIDWSGTSTAMNISKPDIEEDILSFTETRNIVLDELMEVFPFPPLGI